MSFHIRLGSQSFIFAPQEHKLVVIFVYQVHKEIWVLNLVCICCKADGHGFLSRVLGNTYLHIADRWNKACERIDLGLTEAPILSSTGHARESEGQLLGEPPECPSSETIRQLKNHLDKGVHTLDHWASHNVCSINFVLL